jgi:pimeloyl-ACP methyl ester carboxylesterase
MVIPHTLAMLLTSRLLVAAVAGLLLTGVAAGPASAAPRSATATAVEARRVDRVETPKLHWYKCYDIAQCATAKVPLDYDHPHGTQTTIALLRVRATDQKHKIGSLFVNPGGPSGSGTSFALAAPTFLSAALRARFDIVGMDPRGVGFSEQVKCFGSTAAQSKALAGMQASFPMGEKQETAYLAAAKKLGAGCATTGRALAGSMSTAEVARDLDVMRRAVGDKKLNYLGFSYGTALGEYYANMFPDRFRALAIDGTIDPQAWVGSAKTGGTVQDDRLRSADGAYKALEEMLRRCEQAGTAKCAFAGPDVPQKFATLAARLRQTPVRAGSLTITYADFIGDVLEDLYSPSGYLDIAAMAADLWALTGTKSASVRAAAASAYAHRAGRSFPYDNSIDAYSAVLCTDGRHPAKASSWPKLAAAADKRAPYFGRAWAWGSVQCARDTWKVRDEDAYTGPFTRRTQNPVLIVGSFWDPATNYAGAVRTAALMPNSRLLSSDNWGHTAYGTSTCVDKGMDQYLLYRHLPAKGTVCEGDTQPFTGVVSAETVTAPHVTAQGRPLF